jgi:DNA-binding FadR family transcriptional regulator
LLAAHSISMEELLDARPSLEVPIAGRAAVNADDAVCQRLEAAIEAAVGHRPGTPPLNAADGG